VKSFTRTVILPFILAASCGEAYSQGQDDWPVPTVVIFDCNYSSISSAPSPEFATLSSSILRTILADTSMSYLFLLNYGFSDTLAHDSTFVASPFSFIDTSDVSYGDFLIESNVSGTSGNYTVTVSLLDEKSRGVVASGSAGFTDTTASLLATAGQTAASSIVPLIVKIRNYLAQQRNSNSSSYINPIVTVVPSSGNVVLGGSINVDAQVNDCDGTPLAGVTVYFSATDGHVDPASAVTDSHGIASATYTAGSASGIVFLAAGANNLVSLMNDTLSPSGYDLITEGTPDLSGLGRLEFTMKIWKAGYSDDITSTGDRSSNDSAEAYSFKGTAIGGLAETGSTTIFESDSGIVSGQVFTHYFSHFSGLGQCLDFSISGTTFNGAPINKTSSQFGLGVVEYTSNTQSLTSAIWSGGISFSYAWGESPSPGPDGSCVEDATRSEESARDQQKGIGVVFSSPLDPHGQIVPEGDDYVITYLNTVTSSTSTFTSDDMGSTLSITHTYYSGKLSPLRIETAVRDNSSSLPRSYGLSQNYPNPFNPTTHIDYQLPDPGQVTLKVFDVLGREVRTLVDERQSAGYYTVTLDAGKLTSGIYFYRIKAGNYSSVKKLVLLK